jgi:hypothetical protein
MKVPPPSSSIHRHPPSSPLRPSFKLIAIAHANSITITIAIPDPADPAANLGRPVHSTPPPLPLHIRLPSSPPVLQMTMGAIAAA